jgi:hypothetical protein
VTDFSKVNVLVDGDRLISIDEHCLFGRKEIIGSSNMKIYREHADLMDGIWADLYENKLKKVDVIISEMRRSGYKKADINRVLQNYYRLRENAGI